MKKKTYRIIEMALFSLVFFALAACPHTQTSNTAVPENPPFFSDIRPDQGPWEVHVAGDKNGFQKLYVHRKEEAMIAATFARIDAPVNIDLTNPRNQQVLAEMALEGFCKNIEAKCLVNSADLAWIVGTPLQYIYVRFSAEKKGFPPMKGLVYYRFDQPLQTMYLLLADSKVYDGFETVFLNYLSKLEFRPEGF